MIPPGLRRSSDVGAPRATIDGRRRGSLAYSAAIRLRRRNSLTQRCSGDRGVRRAIGIRVAGASLGCGHRSHDVIDMLAAACPACFSAVGALLGVAHGLSLRCGRIRLCRGRGFSGGDLGPYIGHVEFLDSGDQVLQSGSRYRAGLAIDEDAVAERHDRRDRPGFPAPWRAAAGLRCRLWRARHRGATAPSGRRPGRRRGTGRTTTPRSRSAQPGCRRSSSRSRRR